MTQESNEIPVSYGAGWIGEMTGAMGYAATAPDGAVIPIPATAQRSMALNDLQTARELSETAAAETDAVERRQYAARQLVQTDPEYRDGNLSLEGAFTRASRRMIVGDVKAEAAERHAIEEAKTYHATPRSGSRSCAARRTTAPSGSRSTPSAGGFATRATSGAPPLRSSTTRS